MAEIATLTAKIDIPGLPNFVKAHIHGVSDALSIDVADLPSEQLRRLGAQWTEALVSHAEQRRKHRDHDTASSIRALGSK